MKPSCIRYGIACFHRPECKTLHTLTSMGAKSDRILIATNCHDDYEEYSRLYGSKFNVIYREKKNVAGNRNNIIEELGTPCVILDDDIMEFGKYDRHVTKWGRFEKIADIRLLDSLMCECFSMAKKQNAALFGVAASDHTKTAADHFDGMERYSLNGNFQGGFCGYLQNDLRHDESYDVLDDYELNLRILANGGNILRRNDLYARKGKMAGNAGGCKDLYDSGAQERCMKQLSKQWGPLFNVIGNASGIRITCAKVRGVR